MDSTQRRRRVHLPLRRIDYLLEGIAAVLLVTFVATVALTWGSLPERVPTHFGLSGEADAWGGRKSALILPGLGVALFAFLTLIARFPHAMNFPVTITEANAPRQYALARRLLSCVKIALVAMFFGGYLAVRNTALERATGLPVWSLPALIIVLTAAVVTYLVIARREG